jgi:MerR family transcriptional regulator/heat shock protein HspR
MSTETDFLYHGRQPGIKTRTRIGATEPMARAEQDPARGVFGISVAAELVGMGSQNLRLYERRGLLEPDRTEGGTRRYSRDDLDRLRRIGVLLDQGLNLAGIALVLQLEDDNADLRAELDGKP